MNNNNKLTFILNKKIWHTRSIVIGDNNTRAIEPFSLVDKHVTPAVIYIIRHHKTTCNLIDNNFFSNTCIYDL